MASIRLGQVGHTSKRTPATSDFILDAQPSSLSNFTKLGVRRLCRRPAALAACSHLKSSAAISASGAWGLGQGDFSWQKAPAFGSFNAWKKHLSVQPQKGKVSTGLSLAPGMQHGTALAHSTERICEAPGPEPLFASLN